jgi:FtsZ-interacting cell division protein ZipA
MSSLRWILLLAGMLFLAGLAWWEQRRPRQARGGEHPPAEREAVVMPVEPPRETALADSPPGARDGDPDQPLKVVEWSANRRIEPEIALDVPVLMQAPARLEPGIAVDEIPAPLATTRVEPQIAPQERPSLVVDWPPEGERRVVNLRVVPVRVDRFAGRALRLSLTAAGFEHGRFGIFHLAGPHGRVVVSAASLNRPGILDPENMDFQRFGGLNLFAVLPGPLPPGATVDRLVDAACDIAQRLEGRVQDESGMPLDVERLELLRRVATGGEAATGP